MKHVGQGTSTELMKYNMQKSVMRYIFLPSSKEETDTFLTEKLKIEVPFAENTVIQVISYRFDDHLFFDFWPL